MKIGVIYRIRNKVNGKCYVGQTVMLNPKRRLQAHARSTAPIGRAIRKYGLENFEFQVIDWALTKEWLDKKEIAAILYSNSRTTSNGYNLTDGGEGTVGCFPSSVTRDKMSRTRKGVPKSLEMRARLSESLKGRIFTAEWLANLSRALKGKKPSLSTRRTLSTAGKGRVHSKETKLKISLGNLNRAPDSLETRKRRSLAAKKQFKIHGHPMTGHVHSAETLAKIALTSTGRYHSPESRKKMSESHKIRHRVLGHPMLGRHHTEQTKTKMRVSRAAFLNR